MKTAKPVRSASTAIGTRQSTADDGRAAIGRPAYLLINCPSGKFQHLDADTPGAVFDPEVHRFACPTCLAVIRLLPYPVSLASASPHHPLSESDARAVADILSQPPAVGIGVYEPVGGSRGRDQRISVQYLHLPVPEHAVS